MVIAESINGFDKLDSNNKALFKQFCDEWNNTETVFTIAPISIKYVEETEYLHLSTEFTDLEDNKYYEVVKTEIKDLATGQIEEIKGDKPSASIDDKDTRKYLRFEYLRNNNKVWQHIKTDKNGRLTWH